MTLAIKFLVLGVLAVYARAGAVALRRPISDFYVAGRLVPGLFNGMAIALLLIPVLAFAELAGALSQGWEGALLPVLGGAGGLLIIAFLLAPYLRKFGGYTIADFLGERFGGSGVRPLAVLAVILCSFPALALVLSGLGVIAAQIFAVDTGTGIALGVAMLLLCSFAAGMRSASVTQILQYAVLLAVAVVALGLLVWQQGAVFSGAEPAGLKAALGTYQARQLCRGGQPQPPGAAVLPGRRSRIAAASPDARSRHAVDRGGANVVSLGSALCRRAFAACRTLSLAVRGRADARVAGERHPLVRADCRGRDLPLACRRQRARARHRQRALVRPLLPEPASQRLDGAAHPRGPRGRRAYCRPRRRGRLRGAGRHSDHDRSVLLTRGERVSARAPARRLVEARDRRGGACRHARGPRRLSLLPAGAALYPVRLLRDLELPLKRHARRGGALRRAPARVLPRRCVGRERRPWRHGGRWRSSSPIGAASSAILPPCLPCRSVLR